MPGPALRSFTDRPLLSLIEMPDQRPWFPPDPVELGEGAQWVVLDDRSFGSYALVPADEGFELVVVRDGAPSRVGAVFTSGEAFGAVRTRDNKLLLSVNTMEPCTYEDDDGEMIEDEAATGHLWEIDLATLSAREVLDATEWAANGEAVSVLDSGAVVWQVGEETLVLDGNTFEPRLTIPLPAGVGAGELVAVTAASGHWPIRTWFLHLTADDRIRVVAALVDEQAQDWYARDGLLATNQEADACLAVKPTGALAQALEALEAFDADALSDALDELASRSASGSR